MAGGTGHKQWTRTGSLTGNSFLVADALVETAPKLPTVVSGDVVVTDVIQRDVTNCKAQTDRHSIELAENKAGWARGPLGVCRRELRVR